MARLVVWSREEKGGGGDHGFFAGVGGEDGDDKRGAKFGFVTGCSTGSVRVVWLFM